MYNQLYRPRGWLLDTDVVTEFRKGSRAHPGVRPWVEDVPPTTCYLSLLTVVKIQSDLEKTGDPSLRADLAEQLHHDVRVWFGRRILAVDEAVLLAWQRLVDKGQSTNYMYAQHGGLIAATAIVHELGVVTRNVADFEHAGLVTINPWRMEMLPGFCIGDQA